MDYSPLIWLIVGLATLLLSAEVLVRSAERLAHAAGLSPLVIGLTIVSWGSSSPELAVSLESTVEGVTDIAVGNIVGSNIANVLLILGLGAVIAPVRVARQLLRIDGPLMVGVSAILVAFSFDGRLSPFEGGLFVVTLMVLTGIWIRLGRGDDADVFEGERRPPGGIVRNLALVGFCLAGLWIAAGWIIEAAVELASVWGLSELVIGLTIVAVGTSLPEVAISLVAAVRGQAELAVGNVVGSNLFNILGILGLAALASSSGLTIAPAALRFDLPVMLAAALACLPVFFTGGRIDRWEGALFLLYYAAYVTYLLLQAAHHQSAPAFSSAMLLFVIPLTLVTFIVMYGFTGRESLPRKSGSSVDGAE